MEIQYHPLKSFERVYFWGKNLGEEWSVLGDSPLQMRRRGALFKVEVVPDVGKVKMGRLDGVSRT